MVFTDIAGLSDPICKLLDVVSNGVSAIASPWMYKRMERAKQLIIEENSSKNREIAIKDALAEQLIHDLSGRDLREMKNLSDVIGLSAELVNCLPKVCEDPVDPDWAARFFDYAKNCSDGEIKNLWSQILAGELQQPGKFSLRTLDVLRNMSKSDAELIVKFAHRIIGEGLASSGMHVLDIAKLGDIGFINDSSLVRHFNLKQGVPQIIYKDKSYILLIQDKLSDGKTNIGIRALTQAGREISSLIEPQLNDIFLHEIAKELIKNYHGGKLAVSLHKINSADGNVINYNMDPIWEE